MDGLTELPGFIGILTTIMAKSAVHGETVIFIVHLMKNSSISHKNCEKTSELYSLWKVIEKKLFIFIFFASVLSLNYILWKITLIILNVDDLSYPLMGSCLTPGLYTLQSYKPSQTTFVTICTETLNGFLFLKFKGYILF